MLIWFREEEERAGCGRNGVGSELVMTWSLISSGGAVVTLFVIGVVDYCPKWQGSDELANYHTLLRATCLSCWSLQREL